MRWFIGTLVALNLAFLLWSWLGREEAPEGELAAPGVGSIRLLGEAPPEQPAPEPVPIPAPLRPSGVMTAPAEAAAEIAAAPAGDAPPADAPEEGAATPSEPAQAAAAPPAGTPPAAAVPAIATAEAPRVPELDVPPAPAAPPLHCSRIGPFTDASATATVRKYLQGRGTVSSREAEQPVPVGYWVLVPPQASRAAAQAVTKRLQAAGINDFWIVSRGPVKNGISLGVFSQKENADNFLKRATDKGFDAEIREKTRNGKVVWLDYQGKAALQPMEIHARVPQGVTVHRQDCP